MPFLSKLSLFGKAESAAAASNKNETKEQIREWQRRLRREHRDMDRSIRQIEMEERKVENEIKMAAKRNDLNSCKLLAKEIVRSRSAKNRLRESQAHLNSVSMALGHNSVNMKMAGHLQQSTEVMKSMNELIKYPEMKKNMKEMATEMAKMGLIEEQMGDALDTLDPEGIDDDADEEVEKVMEELAAGVLSQLPNKQTGKLPQHQQQDAQQSEAEAARVAALEDRLGAL